MRNEILLSAIGDISDELILSADNVGNMKKHKIIKYVASAACFLLLATVIILNLPPKNVPDLPKKNSELPMLTVTDTNGAAVGYGYEGLMAYRISDLTNANPWNENVRISSLPVYKNLYTYDIYGTLPETATGYAEKLLKEVKKRTCMLKGVEVERSLGGLEIDINFKPEIELNKKYKFGVYSSFKELEQVGKYFLSEYENIIDMKKPILNIYNGDYDINGNQIYNICFFEGKGNLTERIINYHFNRVYFFPDDNGKLSFIRIEKTDLSGKLGDYPIINCQDAKKMLFDGKYITTVPYVLTGNDKVAKTELVYRNGGTEKYYMPYYKFLIELPDNNLKNGLKDFGAYYVPAVESKYITDMPVWDGSFN